jgi:hypothetical protein
VDPLKNPYSPGAGSPPPELVGRDPIIDQARVLLGRVKARLSAKSMLLTGRRGVGKTVLLNAIAGIAQSQDYRCISIEAHEDKPLGPLLAPELKRLLFDLDRIAGAGELVKRAFAVARSWFGTLKLSYNDVTFGLDVEPEKGSADSGDLEVDLPNLLVAIGRAATAKQTAIAIFADEMQFFSHEELGALIMAMHKMQQHQSPIVLLGAGLPILPRLAGESKSYAERLFSFPEVGALSKPDAAKALQDPAQARGVSFEPDALEEVYRLTRGYPYFLQEWGYRAWDLATSSPITLEIVQAASPAVIASLDQDFFRVRYDRLTPTEKNFLRAMASLGPGTLRTSDIAAAMGVRLNRLGPLRASLIEKGMIYSPSYGEIAFTVPLFDEFMIRAIPDFRP